MSPVRRLLFFLGLLIAAPIFLVAGETAIGQPRAEAGAATQTGDGVGRHAFVLGNSGYRHASSLKNAVDDTRAIAAALTELDFDVTSLSDLTGEQMRRAIAEFSRKIAPGDVALFYYAGHGLQYNDTNYLLPVDALIERPSDLALEAQRLNDVIDALASQGTTTIIILDACRINPFIDRLAASGGSRALAVSSGLASVQAGTGIFIGFATQPGTVAYDGAGDNSPFALAILEHIGTPGADIEVVMRRVRMDVIQRTAGAQVPWSNSSLLEPGFVFRQSPGSGGSWNAADVPRSDQKEITFWRSIENETDATAYKAYLEAFPHGTFKHIAKLRIEKLEGTAKTKAASSSKPKPVKRAGASAKTKKPTVAKNLSTTKKPPTKKKATTTRSAVPVAKTERQAASSGRCRDGNLDRCRQRCAEGGRAACRMLRKAGVKP